ncbi:phage head completion protein [Nonomuraea sp. CA-141351]|uniref:phage head completion protein n=1 Tax=Nonomuraea sp. CA-141351 TaxID=3239996 RepID=UPI003D8E0A0D
MAIYVDRLTVLRAPLVDDVYGSVRDWANASVAGSYRASVQPERVSSGSTADEDHDRETVLTTYRVFVPGSADVASADRVQFRGLVYEVIGSPRHWTVGVGRHITFVMRRVDG